MQEVLVPVRALRPLREEGVDGAKVSVGGEEEQSWQFPQIIEEEKISVESTIKYYESYTEIG